MAHNSQVSYSNWSYNMKPKYMTQISGNGGGQKLKQNNMRTLFFKNNRRLEKKKEQKNHHLTQFIPKSLTSCPQFDLNPDVVPHYADIDDVEEFIGHNDNWAYHVHLQNFTEEKNDANQKFLRLQTLFPCLENDVSDIFEHRMKEYLQKEKEMEKQIQVKIETKNEKQRNEILKNLINEEKNKLKDATTSAAGKNKKEKPAKKKEKNKKKKKKKKK